ncbi:MAG: hypothetical protein B7Y72_02430, partial [Mehylophilales bacterium 35-46-6]
MDLSGGIADAEMRLSVLKVSCFRTLTVFIGLTDKIKPPEGGFGNAFGNKSVVLPQTLVIPIDLAEEVRFELTEDFHPRQFSRLVHST